MTNRLFLYNLCYFGFLILKTNRLCFNLLKWLIIKPQYYQSLTTYPSYPVINVGKDKLAKGGGREGFFGYGCTALGFLYFVKICVHSWQITIYENRQFLRHWSRPWRPRTPHVKSHSYYSEGKLYLRPKV